MLHKKNILFIFLIGVVFTCKSQTHVNSSTQEKVLIDEVNKHLLEYKTSPNNSTTLYNLACNYSLLNKSDSAFYFLNLAIDKGADDGWALYDPDLSLIRNHSQWQEIEKKINNVYIQKNPTLDTAITFQLRELFFKDQAIRAIWQTVSDHYGFKSPPVDSLKNSILITDSLNLHVLINFISRYGWPTPKLVGNEGMTAVFIVMQHAPIAYQKKYLPMFEKSAKAGDVPMDQVAYLTDRILVHEHKNQLYGTQLRQNKKNNSLELYPVEDEINLNKRRNRVGLGSIEEYLKGFDVKYIPIENRLDK